MYKITIKKTVEESYIIERNESGSPVTRDEAYRIASLYAQMPEHEFRGHVSAIQARVGYSHRVLGLKDIQAEKIQSSSR